MKKRFSIIAVILSLLVAFPAMAVMQDMSASVYRWSGNYNQDGSPGLTRATTGITYKVLASASNTAETLYVYNDRKFTSLTNPITSTAFAATTGGMVQFRVDPTDSTYDRYVDLIVTDTVGGYSTTVRNFDKYTHTIVIDERPNIMHHGIVWFNMSTTSEVSTGIQLPYLASVNDVRQEVITSGTTTTTLNIGLLSTESGGDADGFLTGRLLSSTGFTADTAFITSGTSMDYVPATTYGALLATGVTGAGTGTGGGSGFLKLSNGGLTRLNHFIVNAASARTISYTASSADGSGKGGYIHYWFTKLR